MKRRKRGGWAIAAALLLILLAAGGWMLYMQPGRLIDEAAVLRQNGDFAGAEAVYTRLSDARVMGVTLSQLPVGRYREAPELIRENLYAEAEALLEAGKYERSSRVFEALGEYRDAPERVNEPYYSQGKQLEGEEAYADAALAYERAQGYADAAQACAYCRGRDALLQARYAEAEEWLTQAGDYADAGALLAANAEAAERARNEEERRAPYREPGHVVEWGSYEQDGDEANGAEPIRWVTLEATEDQVMLIAEQVLDCMPYNSFMLITWEQSDICAWLNGRFLWNAFTEEERAALRSEPVDPEKVSRFDTQDAQDGERVTLLGDHALARYFGTDAEMAATGTAYAVARGLEQTDGYARWWLRMEDYDGDDAALIDGGRGKRPGVRVDEQGVGVRPVIWLSLDALAE